MSLTCQNSIVSTALLSFCIFHLYICSHASRFICQPSEGKNPSTSPPNASPRDIQYSIPKTHRSSRGASCFPQEEKVSTRNPSINGDPQVPEKHRSPAQEGTLLSPGPWSVPWFFQRSPPLAGLRSHGPSRGCRGFSRHVILRCQPVCHPRQEGHCIPPWHSACPEDPWGGKAIITILIQHQKWHVHLSLTHLCVFISRALLLR